MPWLQEVAVALAVVGVLLTIREKRACWLVIVASALLYFFVFLEAGLAMQAGLQIFYVGMGCYGWWAWGPQGVVREIQHWSGYRHGVLILGIGILSLASGWWLQRYSGDTSPYLDSLVTWGAVLTTFMTARKVLESWLYWMVLDTVALYVGVQQGLWPTAALFGGYVVLSVIGWRTWRTIWQHTARQGE